jgi:anti-sigma regulatory factor (Ser/Thr protein kinase)
VHATNGRPMEVRPLYDGGFAGVDRVRNDPHVPIWQVDRDGPVTTLTPRGRPDDGSGPPLRDALLQCLAEYPAAVIVDLSALGVGDDPWLTLLASIVAGAGDRDGGLPPVPLLFAGAGEDVARRLAGLHLNPPYSTVEAARAAATTPSAMADRFATSLVADRSAPAQGRAVVERACRAWRLADLVPAASLVVSELCANAVTHGLPPVRLVIARTATSLHLVVRDGSPQAPLLRPRRPDGQPMESGNGMHLVSAFVRAWGTRPTADGKAVWATIPIGAA